MEIGNHIGNKPANPILNAGIVNRRCSMYGLFTSRRVVYRLNVCKYSIHGAYGNRKRDTVIPKSVKPARNAHGQKYLDVLLGF